MSRLRIMEGSHRTSAKRIATNSIPPVKFVSDTYWGRRYKKKLILDGPGSRPGHDAKRDTDADDQGSSSSTSVSSGLSQSLSTRSIAGDLELPENGERRKSWYSR